MEKVEYFTIRPSLKQLYGRTITKETKFDEKTEDGCVEQHLENLTLTTKVKRGVEASEKNPFSIKEESTMTITMPENTILIWDEQEGFMIPQYQMTTLEGLKKEIQEFEEIYNQEEVKDDIKGNENKNV